MRQYYMLNSHPNDKKYVIILNGSGYVIYTVIFKANVEWTNSIRYTYTDLVNFMLKQPQFKILGRHSGHKLSFISESTIGYSYCNIYISTAQFNIKFGVLK